MSWSLTGWKTSHWIHSFIKRDTKYKKGIDKYKRQKITKCSVKVGLSVTFLIGNSQLSIGFNQKPTIIPTTAVKFFSIWYNYSTFSKFSKGNERQFYISKLLISLKMLGKYMYSTKNSITQLKPCYPNNDTMSRAIQK